MLSPNNRKTIYVSDVIAIWALLPLPSSILLSYHHIASNSISAFFFFFLPHLRRRLFCYCPVAGSCCLFRTIHDIHIACRIYGFVGGLTGTASITTLTAISLDRYFVIIYPLNPAILNSKRLRSIIMIIFVWNYSFLFSIIPALDIGLSRYTPEGFLTSCSFDYLDRHTSARIFMFAFFVSAWVIPLSIIVYCYARILNAVNKTDVPMWSNRMRNQIEHKLIAVVIKVIVLWFLAWTPYAIVALLGITGNEQYLTPWTSMIPALFCKTAACINPYLYSMTHPHFRREISRYLYTWFGIGSAPAVTTTSYPMSVRYGTYRASHTTAKWPTVRLRTDDDSSGVAYNWTVCVGVGVWAINVQFLILRMKWSN